MNDDLLPCPFCGSSELHEEGGIETFRIGCDDCGAEGPTGVDELEATAAWNDRAQIVGN